MTKREKETNTDIQLGDLVKVRIQDSENSERVWAEVVECHVDTQKITVSLRNKPVSPAFEYGEELTLPVGMVLEKFEEE